MECCSRLVALRMIVAGILLLQLSEAFLVDRRRLQPQQWCRGGCLAAPRYESRRGLGACSRLSSKESSDDSDDKEGDNNNNNSNSNIEQERQRLESLLGISSQDDDTNDSSSTSSNSSSSKDLLSLPVSEWKTQVEQSPLLTSIGRERMETEITLLQSLADSDDAIPQLWDLWYASRGPGAAKELTATERLVAQGQPLAWAQAEEMLRQMIAREGIHWVEPVNRLATLLFLQNRYEESLELCLLVLLLKPWHFGALSGIVMVYQRLQDNKGMMKFALQRMPPLPKTKEEEQKLEQRALSSGGLVETRQTWVYRMVDRAQAALLQCEMGLDQSFQDLDKQKKIGNDSSSGGRGGGGESQTSSGSNSDDEDAWQ